MRQPRLHHRKNWPLKDAKGHDFLLVDIGPYLGDVADAFAEALRRERSRAVRVGEPAEIKPHAGVSRTIRVLHKEPGPHQAAVDVTFRTHGRDLYVKFNASARTWIRALQFVMYTSLFIALWSVSYATYFTQTGAYRSLVIEYARKAPNASPEAVTAGLLDGWRWNEREQRWVRSQRLQVMDVFRNDPKVFLTNMAGPPAIIAALVGGLLALLPRGIIHGPCRLLGWPTPDEFSALATGHLAWVEGVLSSLLFQQFRIDERARIMTSK